jgi:hypothetical protein
MLNFKAGLLLLAGANISSFWLGFYNLSVNAAIQSPKWQQHGLKQLLFFTKHLPYYCVYKISYFNCRVPLLQQ